MVHHVPIIYTDLPSAFARKGFLALKTFLHFDVEAKEDDVAEVFVGFVKRLLLERH